MTKENSWLDVWLSCFQALPHLLLSCAQPRRGAGIITQLCSFLWCIWFLSLFQAVSQPVTVIPETSIPNTVIRAHKPVVYFIYSQTSFHIEAAGVAVHSESTSVRMLLCIRVFFCFSSLLPFEQELLYKKLLFSALFQTPVDSLTWMYHTHLLPPAFNELIIWLFQPFVPQILLTCPFLCCSKGHKRSTQKSQISSQFWSCLFPTRAEVAFTASPWQHACSLAPCRLGSRGPLVYLQTKFT